MEAVVDLAHTLDDEGLEPFDRSDIPRHFENWQGWLARSSIYVRIADSEVEPEPEGERRLLALDMHPVRRAFAYSRGIDLTAGVAATAINWNRADDLVVRLTMLAQSVEPFFAE